MRYALRRCRATVSGRSRESKLGGVAGVTYLFPHFPQALQTTEQVAAPQQLAAKERIYKIDDRSARCCAWCRR
jgi:hypothetical protein